MHCPNRVFHNQRLDDMRQDQQQAAARGLENALHGCFQAFSEKVARWHDAPPPQCIPVGEGVEPEAVLSAALAVHLANFTLWHLEDAARRDDLGFEHVARCKRAIDAENQRRNDCIEQLDARLASLIAVFLPCEAPRKYNTETMGGALDRLSILHLKIYHMEQETMRGDAQAEHAARCREKLALLQRQRGDLEQSLLELFAEYKAGRKRPMIYRQFKMYNDPETNPELYGAATGGPGLKQERD